MPSQPYAGDVCDGISCRRWLPVPVSVRRYAQACMEHVPAFCLMQPSAPCGSARIFRFQWRPLCANGRRLLNSIRKAPGGFVLAAAATPLPACAACLMPAAPSDLIGPRCDDVRDAAFDMRQGLCLQAASAASKPWLCQILPSRHDGLCHYGSSTWSHTVSSASFLESRYTQYWFMLMPSFLACSASDRWRLFGILSLNCPE